MLLWAQTPQVLFTFPLRSVQDQDDVEGALLVSAARTVGAAWRPSGGKIWDCFWRERWRDRKGRFALAPGNQAGSTPGCVDEEDDPTRHSRNCRVCRSKDREQIEADFIAWRPQTEIAKQFKLGSRFSVYRHAEAVGLFRKGDANIRAAISNFIERGMRVKVAAQGFVSACQLLSKYPDGK